MKIPVRFSGALWPTFFASLAILALLEAWRPLFFLTDDNLTYWLPIVATMGRRLAAGESPFLNSFLFGGDYNLLRDPVSLSLWNPLVMGLSLLANGRAVLLIVDLFCAFNLVFGAAAFALLLERLRDWQKVAISDARIVFLSLSFTFSGYALIVGPSWLMFLANQAALPLLLMGFLHPQRRPGTVLLTFGLLYSFLVGHLSPFLFAVLFFSLFAAASCWRERTLDPLARWAGALLFAVLLASPVLLPAAQGFASSSRSAPLSLAQTSVFSISGVGLLASFFGGYGGVLFAVIAGIYRLQLTEAFASCAASWTIFASVRRARSPFSALEKQMWALVFLVALFVMRPYWLGVLLHHLPLLRSLRWPFREILPLLFFLHIALALRPTELKPRTYGTLAIIGSLVFVLGQTLARPSFMLMGADRALIMSGRADAYWAHLRPRFGRDDQLIALVEPKMMKDHFGEIPFSLLGAYNYPALFGVRSASGYTASGLANLKLAGSVPYHWSGIFSPKVGAGLLARNPHLKALELVSLSPLRIEIREGARRQSVPVP